MFSAILKHTIQTKIVFLDKTGKKNFLSDLAISAKKYPKMVTQEEKKFQSVHNTFFQNYIGFFSLALWHCSSHVYWHKKTFNQNKSCSLDKTGKEMCCQIWRFQLTNTLKRKISRNPQQCFSKLRRFFKEVLTSFFTC